MRKLGIPSDNEEDLPLLQEEGFDTKIASTRLLGHDMAKISDPKTILNFKGILDAETEEMSQYKLYRYH